jgi:hypothetical protein
VGRPGPREEEDDDASRPRAPSTGEAGDDAAAGSDPPGASYDRSLPAGVLAGDGSAECTGVMPTQLPSVSKKLRSESSPAEEGEPSAPPPASPARPARTASGTVASGAMGCSPHASGVPMRGL